MKNKNGVEVERPFSRFEKVIKVKKYVPFELDCVEGHW